MRSEIADMNRLLPLLCARCAASAHILACLFHIGYEYCEQAGGHHDWHCNWLVCAAAVVLGIGIVVLVFVIKAMASRDQPDITVTNTQTGQTAQVGRGGLVFFLILGGGAVILGIVILIAAIRAVT